MNFLTIEQLHCVNFGQLRKYWQYNEKSNTTY